MIAVIEKQYTIAALNEGYYRCRRLPLIEREWSDSVTTWDSDSVWQVGVVGNGNRASMSDETIADVSR